MDAMRFPLSYKDINSTGIERCNTILKKIFGMVHSENMKLLNQLARLRNSCVHNNAIITNDKDKLNSLISLSNGVLYFQHDEVIFQKGSLDFIISIIKNTLKILNYYSPVQNDDFGAIYINFLPLP
ncbi:hypothetical protein EGK68_26310 [Enterobacter cloacae]|uniref:Uncharacterized protein n=3 Tax=Enterobacter cloacae TaxID=550 RepID=A0A3R8YYA1_ENTCL|nr:hypothetical protein EGK68_26310 [Enterobacter cloacae]